MNTNIIEARLMVQNWIDQNRILALVVLGITAAITLLIAYRTGLLTITGAEARTPRYCPVGTVDVDPGVGRRCVPWSHIYG